MSYRQAKWFCIALAGLPMFIAARVGDQTLGVLWTKMLAALAGYLMGAGTVGYTIASVMKE